jgi:hypothetical protein
MVFCLCFRTKITEPGDVDKNLDSIWNKLPEEICSAYGQKYYEKYKV